MPFLIMNQRLVITSLLPRKNTRYAASEVI